RRPVQTPHIPFRQALRRSAPTATSSRQYTRRFLKSIILQSRNGKRLSALPHSLIALHCIVRVTRVTPLNESTALTSGTHGIVVRNFLTDRCEHGSSAQ